MLFADTEWWVIGLLSAVGALIATVSGAAGAFAMRFLPVWTKSKAQAAADERKLAAQEAEDARKQVKLEAELKREARHQMRGEYGALIDRLNVDIKSRDVIIARHDEQIEKMLADQRKAAEAHMQCLIDNERLKGRVALLEVRLDRSGVLKQLVSDNPEEVAAAEALIKQWTDDALKAKGVLTMPDPRGKGSIVSIPPGGKVTVDADSLHVEAKDEHEPEVKP
jgi:hypothetical protein